MLEELSVKDFALIKDLKIGLSPGLNIITGETGAGKSIILGALGLVLGSKATTDMIRSGSRRSVVEAVFSISREDTLHDLKSYLEDKGLSDEDGALILRREIGVEGKGRSFVNANQVPSGVLKEIGRFLVDIHGQNEHQNILSVDTHRAILDRYAGLGESVKEMRSLHASRDGLTQKLKSVSLNEDDKNRRMEILRHEITELENARLLDNRELEELIALEKSMAHAESILRDLNSVYGILQGEDDSILTRCSQIERILDADTAYDDTLSEPLTRFREAFYLLEDISAELRNKAEKVSLDPEELEIKRERIDLLSEICRKYGGTIESAKAYQEKALNELGGIELSSEEEQKIRDEISLLNKKMSEKALLLSEKRRLAAQELEKKVEKELKDLGMEDTQIRISIKWEFGDEGTLVRQATQSDSAEKKYIIRKDGLDIVEFLMAASLRETLRPLRKIASGGEMSRIMLALKKVIIESDPVGTMVFDEVDAGVGGRVAEAVGKKLAEVSKKSQVLVITHLHQIASLNTGKTHHFKVSKDTEEGTRIVKLSNENRLREVARMIAGKEITTSALDHAKTLLSTRIT